jgi:NAD(P)-dependent dehydrogenase (short-subunit alcohol dehydrogenase family)
VVALEGKVVLVTGGARGRGYGIATAFVKEGASVVFTDIDEAAMAEAESTLGALPQANRVLSINADGKDAEAVSQAVAQTVAEFGRLDVLVNNAQQFVAASPLEETTWDQMLTCYESGVFATWRYMLAAFPHLKAVEGTIINFGSGAGTSATPLHGPYGSNKEAIRGLSRVAAREWGQYGVTVNTISPRAHSNDSKRFEREYPEQIAEVLKVSALGRFGEAEINVGGMCVFLAKPEGRFITGSTLEVNGGAFIRP